HGRIGNLAVHVERKIDFLHILAELRSPATGGLRLESASRQKKSRGNKEDGKRHPKPHSQGLSHKSSTSKFWPASHKRSRQTGTLFLTCDAEKAHAVASEPARFTRSIKDEGYRMMNLATKFR